LMLTTDCLPIDVPISSVYHQVGCLYPCLLLARVSNRPLAESMCAVREGMGV